MPAIGPQRLVVEEEVEVYICGTSKVGPVCVIPGIPVLEQLQQYVAAYCRAAPGIVFLLDGGRVGPGATSADLELTPGTVFDAMLTGGRLDPNLERHLRDEGMDALKFTGYAAAPLAMRC